MAATSFERCDCGGLVPVEDGPTHAYMRAAPACWRMYGELGAILTGEASWLHIDCFAVQHTHGMDTDRRQRASVAVHLVALHLHLEHGITGRRLMTFRQRTTGTVLPALGLADWPTLTPPETFGPATVATVHPALDNRESVGIEAWQVAAWTAWEHAHATVGKWADVLLGARP